MRKIGEYNKTTTKKGTIGTMVHIAERTGVGKFIVCKP